MATFHGIYRGVVMSTEDSLRRGRVQVQVPGVSGAAVAWALPCQPVGHPVAPKVGSGVWVMFEGGDPSRPVWMGVFPDLPA
jgi:phage gp45-like